MPQFTPLPQFTTVAKVGAIPDGEGAAFTVEDRLIAVFNEGGAYRAIDDLCPHMGASLAAGHVEDGIVVCPWHAWRFKTCDGTWCDDPKLSVDAFDVRVEGDEIQVCLTPREKPEVKE
jgi:nitrite reductase (NADH) small subunit/3-phenylpropionate/trans-cinnamate dioxygenase ferredoxin subunit